MDQIQAHQSFSVSLPPDVIQIIQDKVDRGLYSSQNDVIESALRAMDNNTISHEYTENLHRQIMVGVDQANQGLLIDIEDIEAELDSRLNKI